MNKSSRNKGLQLQENKNLGNTPHSSKSPQRTINGVKLYNFSELNSYKYINKPYLNEVKKEKIKNKLDLQKLSNQRLARRIKHNNFFVPYNFNPFSQHNHEKHSKSQANIPPPTDRKSILDDQRNIIDEISKISKKKINKEVESKQFNDIRHGAKKISALVQRQLKYAKSERLPFAKKEQTRSMINLKLRQPQKLREDENQFYLQGELEFDNIIELKEERFVSREINQLNIFHLMHNRNIFHKKQAALDRFYFSFNSLFQKFQKYKIQAYRDLSRDSRRSIAKKPQGKPAEGFDGFTQAQLKFKDLLNVAAGRATPQSVYNQINLEKTNQVTNKSEVDEDQIVYKEGTLNKTTSAMNYNQSSKEVEEFLRLTLTKKEQQYQRINQLKKEDIEEKIARIEKLVGLSIYDRELHKGLRMQIDSKMVAFTDENYKYPKTKQQREALVRQNKQQKGKMEIIKLQELKKSFSMARKHDQKVKELVSKRI